MNSMQVQSFSDTIRSFAYLLNPHKNPNLCFSDKKKPAKGFIFSIKHKFISDRVQLKCSFRAGNQ